MGWSVGVLSFLVVTMVTANIEQDPNIDPASRQLWDFKLAHKKPIGLLTTSSGAPVDIRDTTVLNTDLISNAFYLDSFLHVENEVLPERFIHSKGAGALGYFEVTNDVSKYTKAKVFNGIGKKTHVVTRFSPNIQNRGGSDFERETRGMAVRFYTEEGNLDLVGLHIPVFLFKDPNTFRNFAHAFRRNPVTNLLDNTARYDFVTLRPDSIHPFLWLLSDYGIPRGYRKMHGYMQHAFEIYNQHGDRHIARFTFYSEQGLANYTTEEAMMLKARDPDYFSRDLYNSIARKQYPSWKLTMDVIPLKNISKLNFDPFDLLRLWPKGTYEKVTVGRLILNKNPKNYHAEVEQLAFCPSHLVPGIIGGPDDVFKTRKLVYPNVGRHRLGVNLNKIWINQPLYQRTYNRRGRPPVLDDGKDSPNYYPNSFNGPIPFVDEGKPDKQLTITQSNAVDLEPASFFFRNVLKTEGERVRLVDNIVESLNNVVQPILDRAIKYYTLVDKDLGKRVRAGVEAAKRVQRKKLKQTHYDDMEDEEDDD